MRLNLNIKGLDMDFNPYNYRDKEKFKRRLESCYQCLNKIFENRSRILVIRVDLGYGNYYNQEITLDQAINDFENLRNNMRFNTLLNNGYLGFIRKTEMTQEKGLHHHLMFIYDERSRQSDKWLAEQLGKYWVEVITNGIGVYWNCNAEVEYYRYNGIGTVERGDLDKRSHLVEYVLTYLAKVEQIPLDSAGRRLFECRNIFS